MSTPSPPTIKPLTILFAPLDTWGHINACHGLADLLRQRGHRPVFALDIGYQGKLAKYGYEEYILKRDVDQQQDGRDFWADFVTKYKDCYRLAPEAIMASSTVDGFTIMFENYRQLDRQYRQCLDRVRPDLIVIDSYIGSPTLTNARVGAGDGCIIPWVWLCSAAPQSFLHSPKLPPAWSGLPLDSDQNKWLEFREKYNQVFSDLHHRISQWFVESGARPLSTNRSDINILHPESPYLNIYTYPEELDYYQELKPLPGNWLRIDGSVRETGDTFEIPDQLLARKTSDEKLVFFTIGSYGASNIDLMKRITGILGKSRHRFIVATGPLHRQYQLPANQWGRPFLPQTAVLPLVDLVIAHGGNNTVCETFYYGKPMLVMPMSSDQLDNAQRIHELGLGLRLNPYHCTDGELLAAVDRLATDQGLAARMRMIGETIRMNRQRNGQLAAELIENICK
ncbi:uncharacterized UDP-glucosyltransferase YdhE-like [Oppia nitens]|uniref:uncharacterized UDP-glucosyltransferase YdhE-like n=1 Tax=Oppia nitens TaxID=1686743 RepID=UPI0023DA575A|nr:uncharacterized UDP-glucosyltransferase YdhE-like [Oppia nitens]